MHKVIHLIPYDGIGGVETAARSMFDISDGLLDFKVEEIYPLIGRDRFFGGFGLFGFWGAFFRLWGERPDILIISLWRSCLVGLVLKLLRPSIQLVLFLHLPKDMHFVDLMITRLAARLAVQIWADSHVTLSRRLRGIPADKGRVISFVTARIAELPAKPVCPVFAFWGRIHSQKRLDRALRIFAGIHAECPSAHFWIIGPDCGELETMRALVRELDLASVVQFPGAMSFEEIRLVAAYASFYLQTSDSEGMALSVVEAMQLGLVPVVTPVGEIAHYAHHGHNAVIINDEACAVADVLQLVGDDSRYRTMRRNAISVWMNRPLYKSSVLSACRQLLIQQG